MVWLGGPRRGFGRGKPIVLHDPPPGYQPPIPRISLRAQQREAREEYLLMRIGTVVLILLVAAFLVILVLMLVMYH
jgi:hypothetical protein